MRCACLLILATEALALQKSHAPSSPPLQFKDLLANITVNLGGSWLEDTILEKLLESTSRDFDSAWADMHGASKHGVELECGDRSTRIKSEDYCSNLDVAVDDVVDTCGLRDKLMYQFSKKQQRTYTSNKELSCLITDILHKAAGINSSDHCESFENYLDSVTQLAGDVATYEKAAHETLKIHWARVKTSSENGDKIGHAILMKKVMMVSALVLAYSRAQSDNNIDWGSVATALLYENMRWAVDFQSLPLLSSSHSFEDNKENVCRGVDLLNMLRTSVQVKASGLSSKSRINLRLTSKNYDDVKRFVLDYTTWNASFGLFMEHTHSEPVSVLWLALVWPLIAGGSDWLEYRIVSLMLIMAHQKDPIWPNFSDDPPADIVEIAQLFSVNHRESLKN